MSGRGEERLRRLAGHGTLAAEMASAGELDRQELTSAAYALVWPIVFNRITRRVDQMRGHVAYAAGVGNLADECLDRFHDDVEAVVGDLLANARRPIQNLDCLGRVPTRRGHSGRPPPSARGTGGRYSVPGCPDGSPTS